MIAKVKNLPSLAGLFRSFVCTFEEKVESDSMKAQHANFDSEQRRAGIRRTVWIVAGAAFAMFVLFFLKQGIWH
jgi:hypothetical protein